MAPNSPKPSPSDQFYNHWKPYINFYHKHGLKIHLIMFSRDLLILLPFAQLRWLDCFLPGRLLYGSRIPQASRYLTALTGLMLIMIKLIMEDMGPHFNLFCIDFILFNHRQCGPITHWLLPKWLHKRPPNQVPVKRSNSDLAELHPALHEYFRSQLDEQQMVQRPMRTQFWRHFFGRFHQIGVLIVIFMIIFLYLCNIFLFWPMFFTRRGFEILHENCVRHIVERAQVDPAGTLNSTGSGATFYDLVYRPDFSRSLNEIYSGQTVPLMLAYDKLVPMNVYHVLRTTIDLVECWLGWTIVISLYWYVIYFGTFFSLEAIIYARHLRQQLDATVFKLSSIGALGAPALAASKAKLRYTKSGLQMDTSRAELKVQMAQMNRLQASLVDYFGMIACYNPLVSRLALVNVFIWLFYVFFIFLRHLRADRLRMLAAIDNGVEIEFLGLFTFCLFVSLIFLVLGSILNAQSGKIYRSIVRLVAIERADMRGRKRWLALLNHFEPQKLHCFTLFRYADFSWLSCLKLFSWVISALAILMSI